MNKFMTQTFNDWNPELYLQFNRERMQPAIDLMSKINFEDPESIVDIGCGPGNSTAILRCRWPEARITGIDNSPAMIEKAKHDFPSGKWVLNDAAVALPGRKFDLIFSNATIQWISNHEELIGTFFHMLTGRGVLAVQMPLFWDMPVGKSIARIAEDTRWRERTEPVTKAFTIHPAEFYYEQLSRYFKSINIWVTSYMHIMESHQAIFDMMSSTGLRPYLECLATDQERETFRKRVLLSIVESYPEKNNGKVIYPFMRLFFVTEKKTVG